MSPPRTSPIPEELTQLAVILSYKRPHESAEEMTFVEHHIVAPLVAAGHNVQRFGPMSNIVVEVGTGSQTLFSCHTDTVHSSGGRQALFFDADLEHFFVDHVEEEARYIATPDVETGQLWGFHGDCLGADDGTGIYLMMEMIDAGVPGLYVFHRGEEVGAKGSRWMAENCKELLGKYKRAIAFDRKGDGDVITKQGGSRCASDEFGQALADALNKDTYFRYEIDPTGVFTDTKMYTGIIPECTNLSVGYMSQHTANECQDTRHALQMRDTLVALRWEELPTVRDPAAKDRWQTDWTAYRGNPAAGEIDDEDTEDIETALEIGIEELRTCSAEEFLFQDIEMFLELAEYNPECMLDKAWEFARQIMEQEYDIDRLTKELEKAEELLLKFRKH